MESPGPPLTHSAEVSWRSPCTFHVVVHHAERKAVMFNRTIMSKLENSCCLYGLCVPRQTEGNTRDLRLPPCVYGAALWGFPQTHGDSWHSANFGVRQVLSTVRCTKSFMVIDLEGRCCSLTAALAWIWAQRFSKISIFARFSKPNKLTHKFSTRKDIFGHVHTKLHRLGLVVVG